MKVKFYGTRGSYPVSGPSTVKYGGNTTCVSFTTDVGNGKITRLIIDSGTGIIQLGKEIIGNFFAKKEDLDINILFTHLHPDHVSGLPFFAPVYFKTATINMFGMKALGSGIEDALVAQMSPPTFPIEYFSLKSNRNHLVVYDGDILDFLGFKVSVMQAYAPSHPQQGATYYRVTEKSSGKSVACIWDNESKIGGDKAVINFSKNCDTMIHDTQYTQEEYESEKMIVQGYGHSTYQMAIFNADLAGAKKLIGTHFNPAHDDKKLDYIQAQFNDLIVLAQEGMEIEV
jgi:phosphoribosyl 1,2-cyclic phosphodiesterase